MHPAVVAIGVLITGAVFGILGLLLSVPLISLTLIVVDEFWVKRQAGRPAPPQTGRDAAAPARPDTSPRAV
jgi:predicted PurR-regulated permease PerM